MSKPKTLEEHIQAGTFRMDRHSHLLKQKATTRATSPTAVVTDAPPECWRLTVFAEHVCTPDCTEPDAEETHGGWQNIPVTQTDIERETRYMVKYFGSEHFDTVSTAEMIRQATENLQIRRAVSTQAEYDAVNRASYIERRIGKRLAEY